MRNTGTSLSGCVPASSPAIRLPSSEPSPEVSTRNNPWALALWRVGARLSRKTCPPTVKQPTPTPCNSPPPTAMASGGWLAAEPEATPQTHRLRPWGFPTVSPSRPSVFPHHGIQRITVEFSEKSHHFPVDRPRLAAPGIRPGQGNQRPDTRGRGLTRLDLLRSCRAALLMRNSECGMKRNSIPHSTFYILHSKETVPASFFFSLTCGGAAPPHGGSLGFRRVELDERSVGGTVSSWARRGHRRSDGHLEYRGAGRYGDPRIPGLSDRGSRGPCQLRADGVPALARRPARCRSASRVRRSAARLARASHAAGRPPGKDTGAREPHGCLADGGERAVPFRPRARPACHRPCGERSQGR